ncbi:hypothetical protein P9209_23625 [Prescottella defluvii]|nr:hypothetical protein P9209_23625 [Prescottella defluvii]
MPTLAPPTTRPVRGATRGHLAPAYRPAEGTGRVLTRGSHRPSLFAGLGLLVVTAASARWIHEFARTTVSEDGARLIIDNPHPDYADAAMAMGSERNPHCNS